MDYTVEECPNFKKYYKKASKKYQRTFDDDFDTAMTVIKKKIADSLYNQDPRRLPKTRVISGLGAGVEHDVCKTRMYIEEAQDLIGRLIWLHDEDIECVYLMDIYHKKQRGNHSVEKIRLAYRVYQEEFLGL